MLKFVSNKLELLPSGLAANGESRYTAAVTIRDHHLNNDFTVTKDELPVLIEELTAAMDIAVEMYHEKSSR